MNEISSRRKGLKRDASLRQIEAAMRRVPLCVAVVLTLSTIRPSFGQAVRHSQYDCLTTPNGIPRKVIVTSENAVPYQDPTLKNRCPEELAHFRKYFIFNERKDSYEIGTATISSSRIGWVKKDDVLAWNTTMTLCFINKTASTPLPIEIWTEKDTIGDDSAAHFEQVLDPLCFTEPFPILGTQGDLVEIAFLWAKYTTVKSLDNGEHGSEVGCMSGKGMCLGEQTQKQQDPFRLAMDPVQLESYLDPNKSRVKTGWFRNQDMKNIVICTYVRRRELDYWEVQLRQKLLDHQQDDLESSLDLWTTILDRYVGGFDPATWNELAEAIKDVPLLPAPHDLSLENEKILTRLNNLQMLGMMDKLFNENDEAWVPLGYLPASDW